MTARGVTIGALLALAVAACTGDNGDASPATTRGVATTASSTTAPERPASTTTTAFDPASVEGQVEAAYLRSWDVYADAVYNLELDEAALAEVYADDLLDVRRTEITSRMDEGRAALVNVDHSYRIEITGQDTALVIDTYVNHQVLVDPETKEPTEDDPKSTIVDAFSAKRVGATWVLFDLERLA